MKCLDNNTTIEERKATADLTLTAAQLKRERERDAQKRCLLRCTPK